MNRVPPASRLLKIILGYVAAALVAGIMPLCGYVLVLRIAYGPMLAPVIASAAWTFLKMAGISLLPAVTVVALAEHFSVRAVFAYVLLGVAVLIGCTVYLVRYDGLAFNFAVLSAMTSAGMVAGLVYWRIAGRDAGAWRDPRPDDEPRAQSHQPLPPVPP
ncbi:MAG: hypothetical protein KGJ00_02010 [Bradyrhizobium sp.]|nr:hypothetical protein [Bradyrhizobium sp.]